MGEAEEGEPTKICYTDDLPIMITTSTPQEIKLYGNDGLHQLQKWLRRYRSHMAPDKAITIVFRYRKVQGIRFQVNGVETI